MSLTTFDIETTVRNSFKRKANAFDHGNWVVTLGFKKRGDPAVTEHRFGKQRPGPGWLKPVLAGCKILVGMNIKFDLLHALQDPENLDAWMEWVAAGGNVFDIQLAEYLLQGMGQREQMLSLDEIAPRYGGNVKIDEIKALWAAGVQTEDIDPELLSRYLVGGKDETGEFQLGDVENTEKVALAQMARAHECGQLKSILMNMGSLLCTIEMERNGMYVDTCLGAHLTEELRVEVSRLHKALLAYLPRDLPFEFNWNSSAQKSALIFGGTVQWDGHEYDTDACAVGGETITIYRHVYEALPVDTRPKLLYAQMDVECCNVAGTDEWISIEEAKLRNVPVTRYSSGKREGEVKTKKVKVDNPDKPKGRACKVPYTFKRITEPKKQWASDIPGRWSTASEVIEELAVRNIPFLKAMAELQAASKNLGTYFIVTDPETGESKGMLSLVDPNGLIHHKINHTSTVTGRFSSSDPNLQNIPKGNKSKVKYLFVSRFGYYVHDDMGNLVRVPQGQIIQSDFTALEIYVQAILTKCKQLIADLKAGLDMHVLRLSNSPAGEGKSYEELLVLCKGTATEEPIKEWDYKRTDSKVYSFQAAYGAGDTKIADTTGMAIEMVAALRAADEMRYPEISKYFEARTKEIKLNRKPTGNSVPHPDVEGIFCHLGYSTVRTPDGKLYSYQESPAPEFLVKKGIYVGFSPTEIKNYEVQGSGGEWMKAAMWLMVREFYRVKNFSHLALLVNTVHDAAYVDAHNSVAAQAAIMLHACMTEASTFMEYYFGWTVPVPVPSDTTMGRSMMDDAKIPGIKEAAEPLRQGIRDRYCKGYTPSFAVA